VDTKALDISEGGKRVFQVHGKRILAYSREDKSKNVWGGPMLQLCLSIKIMQTTFIGRPRDLETGTVRNTAKREPFGLKSAYWGTRVKIESEDIIRLVPNTIGGRRPTKFVGVSLSR
jgi:hypothetical protein